jgi:hypothetical protein
VAVRYVPRRREPPVARGILSGHDRPPRRCRSRHRASRSRDAARTTRATTRLPTSRVVLPRRDLVVDRVVRATTAQAKRGVRLVKVGSSRHPVYMTTAPATPGA